MCCVHVGRPEKSSELSRKSVNIFTALQIVFISSRRNEKLLRGLRNTSNCIFQEVIETVNISLQKVYKIIKTTERKCSSEQYGACP